MGTIPTGFRRQAPAIQLVRTERAELRASLCKPLSALLIAIDDGLLPRLEDDVEVAPRERLLRPPAVDDAPFLADHRNSLPVDALRRPVRVRLDEGRARLVYSSRGTNRARASGIRDHGATSTTVHTEPPPVDART